MLPSVRKAVEWYAGHTPAEIRRFISGAVYEDRLRPQAGNERCVVRRRGGGSALVPKEAGIVWVPVPHEGNSQASDEEVDAIERIVEELRGREIVGRDGSVCGLGIGDILFVAPYNLQVRRLERRLGAGARVGSVDRFQGQEAPVVIVSMCASHADASPRGMDFLLDRNRINVALSRAQSLAIVVGSPGLIATRAASLAQVELLNVFCRLVAEGR